MYGSNPMDHWPSQAQPSRRFVNRQPMALEGDHRRAIGSRWMHPWRAPTHEASAGRGVPWIDNDDTSSLEVRDVSRREFELVANRRGRKQ